MAFSVAIAAILQSHEKFDYSCRTGTHHRIGRNSENPVPLDRRQRMRTLSFADILTRNVGACPLETSVTSLLRVASICMHWNSADCIHGRLILYRGLSIVSRLLSGSALSSGHGPTPNLPERPEVKVLPAPVDSELSHAVLEINAHVVLGPIRSLKEIVCLGRGSSLVSSQRPQCLRSFAMTLSCGGLMEAPYCRAPDQPH